MNLFQTTLFLIRSIILFTQVCSIVKGRCHNNSLLLNFCSHGTVWGIFRELASDLLILISTPADRNHLREMTKKYVQILIRLVLFHEGSVGTPEKTSKLKLLFAHVIITNGLEVTTSILSYMLVMSANLTT